MNKKKFIALGAAIFIINIVSMTIVGITMMNLISSPKGTIPMNGLVPNAETAIKIAEAVWYPVYGDDIYSKQPFIAKYNPKDGCWFVNGTLPNNVVGGTPMAKIKKANGKIVYFGHGS